jgi:YgiT-type zinc finger domain-containing protein
MNCQLCKEGTTEAGHVTVTLERGNSLIIIKEVPAHVCTNCGHYYLDADIARQVLQKGEEAVQKGAELEIIKLQAA